MSIEYNITPVPKPRMTRQDKWPNPPPKYKYKEWPRPAVKKYRTFCNQCNLEKVILPCYGSHVTFVLPFPQSFSNKRKTKWIGKPHTQRPDLDNLLKALSDAVYGEDSGIYDIWATKRWGTTGKIIIEDFFGEEMREIIDRKEEKGRPPICKVDRCGID